MLSVKIVLRSFLMRWNSTGVSATGWTSVSVDSSAVCCVSKHLVNKPNTCLKFCNFFWRIDESCQSALLSWYDDTSSPRTSWTTSWKLRHSFRICCVARKISSQSDESTIANWLSIVDFKRWWKTRLVLQLFSFHSVFLALSVACRKILHWLYTSFHQVNVEHLAQPACDVIRTSFAFLFGRSAVFWAIKTDWLNESSISVK